MDDSLSSLDLSLPASVDARRDLGVRGEELAAAFLRRRGYRIVVANFKIPIGRGRNETLVTGEIDLIALDGDTLCFIEVKTRTSDEFAAPLTAIDVRKQRQIIRTAKAYKRVFDIRNVSTRYDAVTVIPQPNDRPRIELVRGFWNEQKFKKKSWTREF